MPRTKSDSFKKERKPCLKWAWSMQNKSHLYPVLWPRWPAPLPPMLARTLIYHPSIIASQHAPYCPFTLVLSFEPCWMGLILDSLVCGTCLHAGVIGNWPLNLDKIPICLVEAFVLIVFSLSICLSHGANRLMANLSCPRHLGNYFPVWGLLSLLLLSCLFSFPKPAASLSI